MNQTKKSIELLHPNVKYWLASFLSTASEYRKDICKYETSRNDKRKRIGYLQVFQMGTSSDLHFYEMNHRNLFVDHTRKRL